jgi:hypothetical protein
MDQKPITTTKPDLPKHLFWDFRYKNIDWQASYLTVIARVLERGTKEEWIEIIRFYSEAKVIYAIKNEIKFLADYAIENVCNYFGLQREELLCYERKKSRRGQWI